MNELIVILLAGLVGLGGGFMAGCMMWNHIKKGG